MGNSHRNRTGKFMRGAIATTIGMIAIACSPQPVESSRSWVVHEQIDELTTTRTMIATLVGQPLRDDGSSGYGPPAPSIILIARSDRDLIEVLAVDAYVNVQPFEIGGAGCLVSCETVINMDGVPRTINLMKFGLERTDEPVSARLGWTLAEGREQYGSAVSFEELRSVAADHSLRWTQQLMRELISAERILIELPIEDGGRQRFEFIVDNPPGQGALS